MGIPEIQAESRRLVKQWTAERKAILDRNEEWRRRWEELGEDTPADRMPAELFKIHGPVACSYDPKVMLCGSATRCSPRGWRKSPSSACGRVLLPALLLVSLTLLGCSSSP